MINGDEQSEIKKSNYQIVNPEELRGRILSQFENEVYGKSIESLFLAGNKFAPSSFPA
jgi:hypothetical protein